MPDSRRMIRMIGIGRHTSGAVFSALHWQPLRSSARGASAVAPPDLRRSSMPVPTKRNTTYLSKQVGNIHLAGDRDTVTPVTTSDDLFDSVDQDGNGTINKDEFARMYDIIQSRLETEHEAQRQKDQALYASQRTLARTENTGSWANLQTSSQHISKFLKK